MKIELTEELLSSIMSQLSLEELDKLRYAIDIEEMERRYKPRRGNMSIEDLFKITGVKRND